MEAVARLPLSQQNEALAALQTNVRSIKDELESTKPLRIAAEFVAFADAVDQAFHRLEARMESLEAALDLLADRTQRDIERLQQRTVD